MAHSVTPRASTPLSNVGILPLRTQEEQRRRLIEVALQEALVKLEQVRADHSAAQCDDLWRILPLRTQEEQRRRLIEGSVPAAGKRQRLAYSRSSRITAMAALIAQSRHFTTH